MGYRIEAGEIEFQILKQKYVKNVIVLPLSDKHNIVNGILAAIEADDGKISREQLLSSLSETLPSYMLPTKMLFSSKLPTTAHGKLDRGKILAILNAAS